jgi:glycosyltransferase involved in cell wall biosynthesis
VALRVFEQLADRGFWGDLCVVGSFEKQIPRVRELYSQSRYRERIHFYGDLGTEKLVELYRGCELFLFPSSSEGFGLPVIEAMYCKAPVLTSNATSLPEAGGDAAVYRDPDDVDGFVAQAERVLHDNELRSSLIDKGWKRADAACWDAAIEKLVEVFEETSRRGRNAPGSPA